LIWFVFTDPENFRESEVGKRGVRGELNQALEAKGSREFAALFFGANVAPDERGANDIPAFIDKDRAVHLAGEANTGDVFASEIRARQRFAHGDTGSAPPVLGLLLGPANLRRGKGPMIFRGRRGEPTSLIDYDRARAAGADVNSENVNGAPRGLPERPARTIISIPAALAREFATAVSRPPLEEVV